jgi:hypothetical protein
MIMAGPFYTIGHSTRPIGDFVELLKDPHKPSHDALLATTQPTPPACDNLGSASAGTTQRWRGSAGNAP